ncbi:trigger factor [Synechococcus elongatus]|uniref:trigger factor n=1 Tax=Synechococcus elongatus TaxID=32046 RepID=UPI0030CA5DD1
MSLKVTQEKLPASRVGLQIEVSGEQSRQVYERTLTRLSREIRLPGFRPGKVPRPVLIQRIGEAALKANALEDLVQQSLEAAIAQESIPAIGNYKLSSEFEALVDSFQPGQPLSFEASVDVQPTATLTQYTGLTVEVEDVPFDANRVDSVLAEQQKQMATLVPVEGRNAAIGDVAVIDFQGVLVESGEEIPGGSGTDFQIEVEEDRFIPGFISGIVGMAIEETRTVDATFPETYPQEEVAGKAAQFTITLKELKTRDLPELDDAFAQEASEYETLEALKAALTERFQAEATNQVKANKRDAILTALADQLDVELPESLLQREVSAMINETATRLSNQGMDVRKLFTEDVLERLRESSKDEAEQRLRRTIALGELAKVTETSVDDEAVAVRAAELLSNYPRPQEIDRDRLNTVVREELLEEKLVEWFEANNSVTLVTPKAEEAEVDASTATVETTATEASEDASAESKAKKGKKKA